VYVCDNLSCVASAEVTATTLPDPPAITTSPSPSTKCIGEAVTFTLVAVGVPPLHYQWKRGVTNVGMDQASYPIAAIAAGDAGSYTCAVSNTGGSITTDAAILTVNTFSTITGVTATPASVNSAVPSSTLSVSGTPGTNAVWKWYTQSCGGTAVGTGQSITVTPTSTTTYYARAEGICGNTSCASVQVTFNPTYRITFNDSNATTHPVPAFIDVVTPGTVGTLPIPPTKTSYVFDGWYKGINGTDSAFTASTPVTASITVWAKWSIKDADGNVYHEVRIGNQVWMVENLKTTKYRDGSMIPFGRDSAIWVYNDSPKYCWVNGDSSYKNPYGALYNWYVVDPANPKKVAPQGWHVPSDTEWWTLVEYLGGLHTAHGPLKEAGFTHWNSPNIDATNSSGFTGLPAGRRNDFSASFDLLGDWGFWWTTVIETNEPLKSRYYGLRFELAMVDNYRSPKKYGFSVRCIRD
jgi:uncharacterized protein (TIGR02145 family)/uncharacterized repeat protein (TIGR02543 family)